MDNDSRSHKKTFELLIEEAQRPFLGWGFSYVKDRMVTAPLKWSYTTEILPVLRQVNSLLDMGTGGGEFLSMLQPFPEKTCATEAHDPNVPVAKKRLESLGVEIVGISGDENLPFEDGIFDLIINRHESYSPSEVHRILSEEGIFLTQQVGAHNDDGLREFFLNDKVSDYPEWTADFAANQLENNGFKILKKKECFPIKRFFDVGAIVFYLLAVPWEVPGFTVEKYRDKLFKLHTIISDSEYIDYVSHRFLIMSSKET